jgi:hypothetical protein
MSLVRKLNLILILLFVFSINIITNSEAALYIDDTSTTDKGHLDLGFSFDYYRDEEKEYDSETEDYTNNISREIDITTDLTFGLNDRWDIGISVPYQFMNDSSFGKVNGFCDFIISSKYRLWDECDTFASYALSLDLKADNANKEKELGTGELDYTMTNIFTKQFRKFIFDLNLGYTFVGGEAENIFIYCFDITKDLNEKISFCNEIYGENTLNKKFNDNILIFASSLSFQVNKMVSLESGVGIGITESSPDFQVSSTVTLSF